MASSASVSDLDSTLTMMSLESEALGMSCRDCCLEGSRTVAMTVVFARLRYFSSRDRPRPLLAPEMRTV